MMVLSLITDVHLTFKNHRRWDSPIFDLLHYFKNVLCGQLLDWLNHFQFFAKFPTNAFCRRWSSITSVRCCLYFWLHNAGHCYEVSHKVRVYRLQRGSARFWTAYWLLNSKLRFPADDYSKFYFPNACHQDFCRGSGAHDWGERAVPLPEPGKVLLFIWTVFTESQ